MRYPAAAIRPGYQVSHFVLELEGILIGLLRSVEGGHASAEVVPAPWTSPEVVERARALMVAIGQAPIVMKRELDGFTFVCDQDDPDAPSPLLSAMMPLEGRLEFEAEPDA